MKRFWEKGKQKTELEKVEQRREEVLATGRKFKYPLQWTKHRIVVNTILIIIVLMAMVMVGGWLALYKMHDTGDLLYRVTKMLPVAVAKVDGKRVAFSDYLMLYRSSVISMERQSSGRFYDGDDSKELRVQYQRTALTKAEEYTYAMKLGQELGIKITDEEIEREFRRHRTMGGAERSEEGFLKIVGDNFGLNKKEYERMLYLALMKSKVEERIDQETMRRVEKIEQLLIANGGDYQAVANELGEEVSYEETGGLVSNKNIDGGRASEAMKLEVGGQSGRFISTNGEGYYFVKLVEKTEAEVNFVSLKVEFGEFNKRFEALNREGKITEFISFK